LISLHRFSFSSSEPPSTTAGHLRSSHLDPWPGHPDFTAAAATHAAILGHRRAPSRPVSCSSVPHRYGPVRWSWPHGSSLDGQRGPARVNSAPQLRPPLQPAISSLWMESLSSPSFTESCHGCIRTGAQGRR
jgi:hypothetical protein